MSHFLVTVALDGTLRPDQIEDALRAALAPFDEDADVSPYIQYTRAQAIEEGRASIDHVRTEMYAEFLADPAAYAARCRTVGHLEYLAGGAEAALANPAIADRVRELIAEEKADTSILARGYEPLSADDSFPPKLEWTDEQVHADFVASYSDVDAEGNVWSTYNPQSKWDWYVIGGRWANAWEVHPSGMEDEVKALTHIAGTGPIREFLGDGDRARIAEMEARAATHADVARKCDINWEKATPTFAFLTSDGEWHETGRMGWWAIVSDEKEADVWAAEYARLRDAEADNAWFVSVDCHI